MVRQNDEPCYSFSGTLEAREPAATARPHDADPYGAAYDQLLQAGELKPDPAQARAVAALDRLAASFASGGLLSRLFGGRGDGPAGVYLWGGVGRGKSMLMDLAFAHIDVHPKRRVHFDEFMLETHARLRKARESEERRPDRAGRRSDRGRSQAAVLRRDAGHQSRPTR